MKRKVKKENRISEMTFDEIFDSRLQYFELNQELFSKSQFQFLRSVQQWGLKYPLTEKQKDAFISIVDSVWSYEHKYSKNYQLN